MRIPVALFFLLLFMSAALCGEEVDALKKELAQLQTGLRAAQNRLNQLNQQVTANRDDSEMQKVLAARSEAYGRLNRQIAAKIQADPGGSDCVRRRNEAGLRLAALRRQGRRKGEDPAMPEEIETAQKEYNELHREYRGFYNLAIKDPELKPAQDAVNRINQEFIQLRLKRVEALPEGVKVLQEIEQNRAEQRRVRGAIREASRKKK